MLNKLSCHLTAPNLSSSVRQNLNQFSTAIQNVSSFLSFKLILRLINAVKKQATTVFKIFFDVCLEKDLPLRLDDKKNKKNSLPLRNVTPIES